MSKSAKLYRRALESLPGGVSRNAVLRKPHPLYVERGFGSRVVDVDGVEIVDFANNMASMIHGHAHPAIVDAVSAQLSRGTSFNLATEVEIRFAEHMRSRNESFERIRFVNSGTEAVMVALKVARAHTGRPMVAKVEGAYHGIYDYAEVSQTAGPGTWGDLDDPQRVPVVYGTPRGALEDVVVIPFNDFERSLAILDRHRGALAAVLIDPMPHRVGLMPARSDFIDALYSWTRSDGSLLVFDEVVTFRSSYGGAQEWYPVSPDLTAMGKMIGGGFPVGAVAGRSDVLEVMNPLAEKVLFPHSGTFSANPVTMTAGLTAMEMFDREAVDRLNRMAKKTRARIEDVIASKDLPMSVTGGGSMLRIHPKPTAPSTYREAYPEPAETAAIAQLLDLLLSKRVMLINSCSAALSTPMGEEDIQVLVDAFEWAAGEIKPAFRTRS